MLIDVLILLVYVLDQTGKMILARFNNLLLFFFKSLKKISKAILNVGQYFATSVFDDHIPIIESPEQQFHFLYFVVNIELVACELLRK